MKKNYIVAGIIVVVLGIVALWYQNSKVDAVHAAASYKDATYTIEGTPVTLKDGYAEEAAAPGSASKLITRYFGNEVKHDFDGDGREDIAFLLTREQGGSGVFYYVVAALNTKNGYVGSHGLLLGDRIAPQTTEMSQKAETPHVIIVNYATRAPGESFAVTPSVGKSMWLLLDPATMQFGEVAQNFEGESAAALKESEARSIAERSCIKGGDALTAGTYNRAAQTWTYDANLNMTEPGCRFLCVVSEVSQTAEVKRMCSADTTP